jgi:hypothetical protein
MRVSHVDFYTTSVPDVILCLAQYPRQSDALAEVSSHGRVDDNNVLLNDRRPAEER